MANSKDYDKDYQAKINEAVKIGDYASASKWEQERNEKIDALGLAYEKTYNYTIPKGVDGDTYNKMKSTFSPSSDVTKADKKKNSALSNLEGLTSKEDIISDSVWKDINSSFRLPSAVVEADTWIASQLEKIQSGKTSYSDQVKAMMDKIMNREKFSYDVDTDPLFQQALASAMNSGKQAMQDTIGQASALTGGYGSTYATSAGNQAYNAFIEDAYDNLPQYYQMAMEAYQMEGDEMYRQYSMLSTEDDKEYNRNITAYDATYQHRNQLYNEAYSQFRDNKSDAFATANLQLNEHGQRVSDAYNYYNATSNYADTLYNREYTQWADSVNQATQMAQILNSDWQNQANRDFQASENQKDRDLTVSENAKNRAASRSGGGGGNPTLKEPTQPQMSAALKEYNEGGVNGLKTYLASVPSTYDRQVISDYATSYGEKWVTEYDSFQGWEISNDTNNGWFIFGKGEDHNDEYSKTDANSQKTTLTYDDLKEQIKNSNMPKEKQEELLKQLQGQSKK